MISSSSCSNTSSELWQSVAVWAVHGRSPESVLIDQFAEPLQRAALPRLDGFLGDFQDGGGLFDRELLQEPQDQHFAVAWIELRECRLHAGLEFLLHQLLVGAGAFADQPLGQFHRRLVGQRHVDAFFPRDGPRLGQRC